MFSPAQSLAIYTGSTLLAYIETGGFEKPIYGKNTVIVARPSMKTALFGRTPVKFVRVSQRRNHKILLSLPMAVLTLLTLATTMNAKVRGATALSFLMTAVATLSQTTTRSTNPTPALLYTFANGLYYLSFSGIVEYTSGGVLATIFGFTFTLFFVVIQDLVVAIPYLTIVLTILLTSHVLLIVASASVCLNGHHGDYDARQASYIRLVGSIIGWLSTFLFIYNSFQTHTAFLNTFSRILFYFSNSLLFIANERAF